jgi:hypothetical protein
MIVMEVLNPMSYLNKAGNSDMFCSIPGHMDMAGNEVADAAARENVLQGNLSSERALGDDVHTYLICAVLSFQSGACTHTQDHKLQALKLSIEEW